MRPVLDCLDRPFQWLYPSGTHTPLGASSLQVIHSALALTRAGLEVNGARSPRRLSSGLSTLWVPSSRLTLVHFAGRRDSGERNPSLW